MKKTYERYIKKPVEEDLKSTMVFIGGPRQTGKTTFALNFLPEPMLPMPLSWLPVATAMFFFFLQMP